MADRTDTTPTPEPNSDPTVHNSTLPLLVDPTLLSVQINDAVKSVLWNEVAMLKKGEAITDASSHLQHVIKAEVENELKNFREKLSGWSNKVCPRRCMHDDERHQSIAEKAWDILSGAFVLTTFGFAAFNATQQKKADAAAEESAWVGVGVCFADESGELKAQDKCVRAAGARRKSLR